MRRGWAVIGMLVALLPISACSTTGATPPTATVAPTPPRPAIEVPTHARAYFFGDSWAEGQVARRGRGFPYVTSELLGWTPVVDGVGGTGYVAHSRANTQAYPVRAAAIPDGTDADIVIVEGGLNDELVPHTGLQAAVRETLQTLRARFPGKPIVVMGPAPRALPVPTALREVDRLIRDACAEARVPYISPLARQWVTGLNFRDIIDASTRHPSTAGHAYVGGRLAVVLQDLMIQPQDTDAPSPREVQQSARVG